MNAYITATIGNGGDGVMLRREQAQCHLHAAKCRQSGRLSRKLKAA